VDVGAFKQFSILIFEGPIRPSWGGGTHHGLWGIDAPESEEGRR